MKFNSYLKFETKNNFLSKEYRMISGNYYLHKLISDDVRKKSNDKNNDKNKTNNKINRSKVIIKEQLPSPRMLRNKSMDNFLKFQWPWIL
jgi:hypothetical protein